MIEKTYQPATVESRIYDAWEAAGAFRAGRPERAKAQPYCIVIPPPNVTGSLHMGHALNNTLQDILCRFERMRGKDVLWQPGTDHAGIATQAVVERQLMERQQPSSRDMGREAFIKRVWEWKAESGGTIISQLKRLGASCDWSRERFTMDEGLSRAVMKVFVALYRDGLIYKDKRLVNWDPKLKTAISDLEVQQVETKGHLWHIKYPIEGSDEFVIVATTRPETMLGDVAVAVHPENARLKHLIGKTAILPLVGRRIPIIGDDYADPEKGSGAVKITPAHDFNDFEVGRRHDLPLINVFDAGAHLDLKDNAAFLDGVPPSAELDATLASHGFDRFAVRKKIVERLEAAGLIDKIEPATHVVPHGDRSGAVLEPFLTDQWYVDAKTLAAPAIKAVRERKTVFVPAQWEATFFNWMENIQPWCVSRQIWWGHQIPAWYGPDGKVFVAENEDVVVADALAHYTEIEEITAEDGHDIAADPARRARFANEYLHRDEDVLDTWFSSALWPFSTLGWPDQTPELKRFYPTSALVTGFDIIFFWVARMMMMGLHFMKEVPFRDVYIHALVRDATGAKMSKSKGNVIDPLNMIDEFGADALRFTLAAMAAQGRDIKLSTQRVEGYRNFATKLWNAARFAEINGCARDPDFDPHHAKETLNRWIAHETAKAGREVTAAIEAYKFNEAASAIYRFVWNVYCDWYLELIKPVLTGPDGAVKTETRAAVAWVLDEILKLLHPFMPFVTEELWSVTAERGAKREQMLALDAWPQHDGLDDAAAEAEIGWVIDLVSAIRSVRTEMNVPASATLPLNISVPPSEVSSTLLQWDRVVEQWREPLRRLARLSSVELFAHPGRMTGQVNLVVRGTVAVLNVGNAINIAEEQARLQKEIVRCDADIARVDQKLGNPNFVARAPEEVVEEEKEKREEAERRKAKITEALERLGGLSLAELESTLAKKPRVTGAGGTKMLDFSYPKILELFSKYKDPKRTESASFLIWYLENYYRLDSDDAVDFVCDQSGDKGVDGIFVNDSDQTITIFQSKILQSKTATVGDKALREFAGTIAQFETPEKIDNLMKSAGAAHVAALTKRLDLVNKISTHDLRGEFVTNNDIDSNGTAFLKGAKHIMFIGGDELHKNFISSERDKPIHDPASFDIVGFTASEYIVDKNIKAIIAPVRAAELVKMSGIADQSLFMYNVRGSLGRTHVNKDIVKTIEKAEWHKLFPLFHNGITIIAAGVKSDAHSIEVQDYFVVNGCQSLTALHSNIGKITGDLRILTKFIKMDPASELAAQITEYSNNQNPPKPRDSKSNNQLQIRLQNECKAKYKGDYAFEIKQGEKSGGNRITNEDAGLYLMAFDLEEPWATHRKYQVFEDKYSDLFGRPEVTADRIVFLQVIMEEIQKQLPKIENGLFAKYALTRYLILYILRQLLERDEFSRMAIQIPDKFVFEKTHRDVFRTVIATMIGDIIADVNAEVNEYKDDFDYRDKLRDEAWVKDLAAEVKSTYEKLINRKTIKTFKEEWETRLKEMKSGKGKTSAS